MDEATLYVNGRIYTMDARNGRADAMLVSGERITAIGERADVENAAGTGTRRVDLQGQTVLPGFNDCHCHILSFGLNLEQLDVSPEKVRNIEDVKRILAERAEQSASGQESGGWIRGRGYNQNDLEERRHPNRFDMDEVSHGQPVVLWHTSGHALTANSRVLELAGITDNTPNPPGGELERDEHGRPTGVLKESAMDLVAAVVPPPTQDEGRRAVLLAMQTMARQGITSASDANTGQGPSIDAALQMYRAAAESGELAGRITLMPGITYVAPPHSDEAHQPGEFDAGSNPRMLQIGATKIFSDGALTTRTAALREPYLESESRGILLWEPEVLESMIWRAHDAGWQIGTHAIGDRAVALVVQSYRRALEGNPREGHRHRIEHCMMLDDVIAAEMAALGIIPTIQPGFMSRLGDGYIAAIGAERSADLMPMALFNRHGITVGFSSDRPVIPGLPLQGIRAAVERKTPSGRVLGPEHAISVLEAIRLYTVGSAYAIGAESERGRLQPGMLADFLVLDRDPLETPAEEITEIDIRQTVVGGTPV